jgi:putative ABC transport system permease protein
MLAIRVGQIAAMEDVVSVFPVYQSADDFRGGAGESEHRINVVAFPPDHPALELAWTRETLELLREPGTVLLDRLSRPIYGSLTAGRDVWLEGRRLKLGGFVELGPTMVADGLLVMSEGTFKSFKPGATPRMAIVTLASGADPERARARIAEALGPSVRVFVKSGLAERETAYLRRIAPLGLLFGAGMTAGLFVGLVMCYQVLYMAVRRRLKAFATIKAMGFGNSFILKTILEQALALGLAGYALGLALTLVAYETLAARSALPIELTWGRASSVAIACLAACGLAGAIAAVRAMRTPPAELF